MITLLLAAMLTTADAGAPDATAIAIDTANAWSNSTAKLLSLRHAATELLYIDSHGQLHLVRWCTPWDVAEAVLASQPRAVEGTKP